MKIYWVFLSAVKPMGGDGERRIFFITLGKFIPCYARRFQVRERDNARDKV